MQIFRSLLGGLGFWEAAHAGRLIPGMSGRTLKSDCRPLEGIQCKSSLTYGVYLGTIEGTSIWVPLEGPIQHPLTNYARILLTVSRHSCVEMLSAPRGAQLCS